MKRRSRVEIQSKNQLPSYGSPIVLNDTYVCSFQPTSYPSSLLSIKFHVDAENPSCYNRDNWKIIPTSVKMMTTRENILPMRRDGLKLENIPILYRNNPEYNPLIGNKGLFCNFTAHTGSGVFPQLINTLLYYLMLGYYVSEESDSQDTPSMYPVGPLDILFGDTDVFATEFEDIWAKYEIVEDSGGGPQPPPPESSSESSGPESSPEPPPESSPEQPPESSPTESSYVPPESSTLEPSSPYDPSPPPPESSPTESSYIPPHSSPYDPPSPPPPDSSPKESSVPSGSGTSESSTPTIYGCPSLGLSGTGAWVPGTKLYVQFNTVTEREYREGVSEVLSAYTYIAEFPYIEGEDVIESSYAMVTTWDRVESDIYGEHNCDYPGAEAYLTTSFDTTEYPEPEPSLYAQGYVNIAVTWTYPYGSSPGRPEITCPPGSFSVANPCPLIWFRHSYIPGVEDIKRYMITPYNIYWYSFEGPSYEDDPDWERLVYSYSLRISTVDT